MARSHRPESFHWPALPPYPERSEARACFRPGGEGWNEAAFHSFADPQPDTFSPARVVPDAASFSHDPGESVLLHESFARRLPPTTRRWLSSSRRTAWLPILVARTGVPRDAETKPGEVIS